MTDRGECDTGPTRGDGLRLKIPNDIFTIDILTVLLVISITFFPSIVARIILGLPFLLFFPGYTLVAALFAKKDTMDGLERVALSGGMSIAIVGLIGFGLNYTSWGIRLEPVLYSITAFVFVMSSIALIRRGLARGTRGLTTEVTLRFPGWEGTAFNKSLSIVLGVAIFGALGVLCYTVAVPKVGERFTEFYILGIDGKAQDYPTEFTLDNGKVARVVYGDGASEVVAGSGDVTVGIVNHEQQTVAYSVKLTIDGEPANIELGGVAAGFLGPFELRQGEKWENAIGIVPRHAGENQKVELLLFKGSDALPENTLHLWIAVREAQ